MPETLSVPNRSLVAVIKEWAEMIKIEHTVFALPFALSGLILAQRQLPPLSTVFWTILAFLGARCAAMTLNRLIDAEIDAKNPRTKMRPIPAGKITKTQAMVISVVSFAVMELAASRLPIICVWLSPIAIFWLTFYSYTKRFTYLCHLILGVALGGAALGGWVAAGGAPTAIPPYVLALAVTTWVAGFDIIYACQDVQFDKDESLHSLPSKFGIKAALNISIALHVVTVSALAAVGILLGLKTFFWIGFAVVTAMLVYEHSIVSEQDLSRVNAAFFTVNGVVSILAFIAILCDRLFS